ncbi:hypothetical protein ACJJTC_010794 [Scirpophaga incertulas]
MHIDDSLLDVDEFILLEMIMVKIVRDGSSAGSPKEACVQSPPPPPPAKRDARHHRDQRRLSIGGAAGGSRRAERRASERRSDMRLSPGAGPSAEPPHLLHTPHHHMDTNPLEGPVAMESAASGGSSDGELSSKAGDSPSRKRRRISRHLSSACYYPVTPVLHTTPEGAQLT